MSHEQTHTGRANIGVVGLAVMGANLARNLASREGNTLTIYNRSPGRTRASSISIPKRASWRRSPSHERRS